MAWSERFVTGRVRRRMLRTPLLEGWMADELGQAAIERVRLPLKKIDDVLAVAPPDGTDLVKLGTRVSALAASGDCELMIGWPERIVIARTRGVVVHAEGDVVHFGPLALDRDHSIERTGYEYVAETGAEVRVELLLRVGGQERRAMLDPDQTAEAGAYQVHHQHSFDPSDRPGGTRQHGYAFTVSRTGPPPQAPAVDLPHPLDIDDPRALLDLARQRQLLGDDEAVLGEGAPLSSLLDRYEGPRHHLEEQLAETGPPAPELCRLGEALRVTAAAVWRGDHGEACYGRQSLTLDATGQLALDRQPLGTMPGRLRKRH